MKYKETKLSGSYLINLEPKFDERGFFSRYYCFNEFEEHGLNTNWPQINTSFSKDIGTLRGLHFQNEPMSEVKLVRCISGSIWDVIVDLRKDSITYRSWFGVELNAYNRTMLYIPKGFAHGFITLAPNTEIIYMVSQYFSAEHELSLLWNDPTIGIDWLINPTIISEKDKNASSFQKLQSNF